MKDYWQKKQRMLFATQKKAIKHQDLQSSRKKKREPRAGDGRLWIKLFCIRMNYQHQLVYFLGQTRRFMSLRSTAVNTEADSCSRAAHWVTHCQN